MLRTGLSRAELREQEEQERKRDRLAALFFLLFPLMIAAGFMVPGFVSAVSDGNGVRVERVAVAEPGPVELDHTPLRVPRNFGRRVGTIDLEELFGKEITRRFAGERKRRESSFEAASGAPIVLDEVTPQERLVSFEDATPTDTPTRINLQIDEDQQDWILDELFDADTALFDEHEDESLPVVPEPGSGALLAYGVLFAGVVRRFRR